MRKTMLYEVTPTKGEFQGLHMVMMTPVRNCRQERCPIHDLCTYEQRGTFKCKVEATYLDAIFKSLVGSVHNALNQEILNKFTLHVMPLHHMLIRFKIKAFGLDDVCIQNKYGVEMVHPIFNEIRRTISAIESSQRSLGLDLEYVRALGLAGRGLKGAGRGRTQGNADYWDDWKEDFKDEIFPEGQEATGIKRATIVEESSSADEENI